MQMLVNFKLCWTASCIKRYGLKHSHRKHSLFSLLQFYFQLSAFGLTSPETAWLNWWWSLQVAKMCRLIIIAALNNWFPQCDHQHLSCSPCFQTGQFSQFGDAECKTTKNSVWINLIVITELQLATKYHTAAHLLPASHPSGIKKRIGKR